jgi:hypothetical protein
LGGDAQFFAGFDDHVAHLTPKEADFFGGLLAFSDRFFYSSSQPNRIDLLIGTPTERI